jgi:hypothetical protein
VEREVLCCVGGHPEHDDIAVPFFWQASQEVEEEKAEGKRTVRERRGASNPELRYAA